MKTRILFVDDEVGLLDELQNSLSVNQDQWQMNFVYGGVAALEHIEQFPVDVIVSDMRMPCMDGVQLLRQVKGIDPKIVRIVLSGYAEEKKAMLAASLAHRFLSKPCNLEELYQAIESTYALKYLLDSDVVQCLVGEVGQLPTTMRRLNELQTAAESDGVTIDDLVEVIEPDIAATAKVLQVVNSAFFRRIREVSTVRDSVVYLGIEITRSVVLAQQLNVLLGSDSSLKESTLESIQDHCFKVGMVAKAICPAELKAETAFSAGVLSGVGALLTLGQCYTDAAELWTLMQTDIDAAIFVEENELNANHLVVGGCLLQLWGLPYTLVSAVACQRHPSALPGNKMGYDGVLHIANALVKHLALGKSITDEFDFMDSGYLQEIGCRKQVTSWVAMAEKLLSTQANDDSDSAGNKAA